MPVTSPRARFPIHGMLGAALVVVGEALIVVRLRPASDFYFPFVWLGYTLLLDGAVYRQTGHSLFSSARRYWLLLFPISSAFWWLFELFNGAVHSWYYVGGDAYTGAGYVLFASIDFATVLAAVWTSAHFVSCLVPDRRGEQGPEGPVPAWLLGASAVAGMACIVLPVAAPRYFFGGLWLCLFLLLDPINCALGRPSMLRSIWHRRWRLPLSFALGALMCGFFWEGWNYWSMPKWLYNIPYVGFWHIFEMPLLGWAGYLPFGLELFAMTNFVLLILGMRPMRWMPETEAADATASPATARSAAPAES